ncbi:DUF927 domain-containing protein [Laribacter hongkongensis]|uniref:DUF927 domain-containing protein n=1 Tax=Laribacter hongkongensis TaxID=168471 RepID=UPI001EFD9D56|nr:DUF927 domain-containing protein [Laribacter hongkongensis]MCG9065058.1 DUF927 domain-containing protein [Laribacter hongkongensis]
MNDTTKLHIVPADHQPATSAKSGLPVPFPRYDRRSDGLYFIDGKVDPETGERIEKPAIWLCASFQIIGSGKDNKGDVYRLLHWKDAVDQQSHRIALPSAIIGERECWKILRAGGLAVAASRFAQEKLAMYLQREGSQQPHQIIVQTGWCNGSYILPGGETIGQPDIPVFYSGDTTCARHYRSRCSLKDWQDTVGHMASGNPLPMTAIACALAGPLLALIDARDGIGLHLYGGSATGKSTCGDIAASIWGDPAKLLQSWSGTGVGLSNMAEASNDGLLYLDEVGSGDPRKIGPAIYSMLNGVSKAQGTKEGGNRESRSWRLSLISTGEVRMSQFLDEGGQTTRGGQEVRLLDLPADSGRYRAFDCLHGHIDGEAFSTALTDAARTHSGAIGRAWVGWLAEHRDEVRKTVLDSQNRLLAMLPDCAAPTVRRATKKFGVLLAAAIMASRAGLTGWTEQEAIDGVSGGWAIWLDDFGLEDRDDARLIEQAVGVLKSNELARFRLLPIDEAKADPVIRDLMGYRRFESDGQVVFFVLPHAFKNEVIAGYEVKQACKALHRSGLLKKHGDGWTQNAGKRIGRAYWMVAIPMDTDKSKN